jgi:hypothetical protein
VGKEKREKKPLGRPMHKEDCNFKMDVKNWEMEMSGFILGRI